MWQLFALGAILSNAIENTVDKIALVEDENLDPYIATFLRVTMYIIMMILIGLTGILGPVHFYFNWVIILLGIFGALNSLSYTYTLKKIEVTSIGIISYTGPLVFLAIDTYLLNVSFSLFQIFGIFLLLLGGIGFSINGTDFKFKKELSSKIWVLFLFWFIFGAVEAYTFQSLAHSIGLSAPSFFLSSWGISLVILLIIALCKSSPRSFFSPTASRFFMQSGVGKFCDALSTVLAAQVLIYASVSQASAMDILYPLILLACVFVAQELFGLKLDEKMDRSNLSLKILSIIFLVIGGFLIR